MGVCMMIMKKGKAEAAQWGEDMQTLPIPGICPFLFFFFFFPTFLCSTEKCCFTTVHQLSSPCFALDILNGKFGQA